MEFNRKETSMIKFPLLDGTNYAYWKIRMIAFLRAIDYQVWDIIMDGYSDPTVVVDRQTKLKSKAQWTTIEKTNSNCNNKGIMQSTIE